MEQPALPSRKFILIWLVISQIVALLSLLVWFAFAGLSIMAFDSGVTPEASRFVIAIWSYPLWPLAFSIAAWVAYARRRDRLAAVLSALTFLPILIVMLLLTIYSMISF